MCDLGGCELPEVGERPGTPVELSETAFSAIFPRRISAFDMPGKPSALFSKAIVAGFRGKVA